MFSTDLILSHICTNYLYNLIFHTSKLVIRTFQSLSLHSFHALTAQPPKIGLLPQYLSVIHLCLYLLEAMDTLDHGLLYEVMLLTLTSKGLCHLAPTHASYLRYHSFPTVVYYLDKLDFLLLPFHTKGVPILAGLPLIPISTGHKSYQFTPVALTCQELDDHYQFALSPNEVLTPKLQHNVFGLFPHLQLLSHHILVIYNLFYLPYHRQCS